MWKGNVVSGRLFCVFLALVYMNILPEKIPKEVTSHFADLETLMRGEGEFRHQALGWKLGRARVHGGGWPAKPRESA